MLKKNGFVYCAILLSSCYGCTGNPLTENDISLRNREIKGSVIVGDGLSKQGVYVWLDGFNIGTRTDESGRFQITLPVSGPTDGVTGAFHIHYYVANFALGLTEVFIRNGEFLYSLGEIDKQGVLIAPKFLQQRLQIQTTVQPSQISFGDLTGTDQPLISLSVEVTLRSFVDSVIVFFPEKVQETSGPLMIRDVNTNGISILSSRLAEPKASGWDTVGTTPTVRKFSVMLDRDSLPPGEFEVMPYLLVNNEEIPAKLLEGLGPTINELGPGYLNIPFRRQGASRFLTVND